MANAYVNKVQLADGTSLIDISDSTATADKILQGYTAYGADGQKLTGTATGGSGSGVVWQDQDGYVHLSDEGDMPLQTKTVTPTTSAQTITADAGYYALEEVNVNAIPTGTAGTPTATKGTVSNHAITVTPSVTNITGYITGSTKTGTGVSVSASELVSGTYSVTSSGTKDVTNYASASVPSGTEGTPTATKGAVSNHSVTVTPSVTNSGGYITGSTKTGTAVTVSASELVSGTKSISANGTGIDVTNYASVDVAVPSVSPTLISKSITANGTYNASSDNADGYSSVTVNVSGGGSSYNPISVGTLEITAEVTSTSATILDDSSQIDISSLSVGDLLYIKIRDKAGKRDGYFYGVDQYYIWGDMTDHSYASTRIYRFRDTLKSYTTGSTTGYGVYLTEIDTAGILITRGRYNSTYSYTINGTYSIDIYKLEWPNNVSPFD